MDGRRSANAALSLVIPAFNEGPGIGRAVAEALAALARFTHSYEVLVVDDGSTDDTAEIVAELARENGRIRLLKHEKNQGYGAALRTGFEAARYDYVAFTDADCQFDLADLEPLLTLAIEKGIAVGRRENRKDIARRRFFSWGYNCLVRTLLGTGVRDCDCALKVFRRDLLQQILPTTPGFFVNTEMLTRVHQLGIKPAERAVAHRPRLDGVSKVTLGEIPRTLATLVPFWWSQVLFPASAAEPHPSEPAIRRPAWEFWIVLATACLIFFSRSHLPLQEPEESRYAEIPRQMLATGSFAVPVLHSQPYYDKPPLLYWLVMASYRTFGVHDWAARLVMSLAGLGTVLVTYFWGAQAFNRRTGLAAALVLCLGARFVYLERLVTMNGLLALWTTAALAAAYFALAGGRVRRGYWMLAAVCCSLGLLTKGPVAVVLFAGPVLLWPWLDPRVARPGVRHWALFATLIGIVAGPWFLAASFQDPEFVSYFFWKHHIVRYVAPFDHAKPPWFYAGDLIFGLFPGSILLVPLGALLLERAGPDARRRATGLGFALLAAVWCFAFFSLAGSKRAGYILPLLPLLALACGVALDSLLGSLRRSVINRCGNLGRHLTQAIWVGAGCCCIGAVQFGLLGLVPGVLLMLVCVVALACGREMLRKLTPAQLWAASALSMFILLLASAQLILPGYAKRFAMRNQVRGQLVAGADPAVPVVCYPRGWDSVNFYLGRTDVRVYTRDQRGMLVLDLEKEPRTLAFIKAGVSLTEFLGALPKELEFLEQGQRGEVAVGWVRPKLTAPDNLLARDR